MATHTISGLKPLQAPIRYHLLESWTNAIGILRDKRIDPLRYQKQIRKGWGARMKRQEIVYCEQCYQAEVV